MKNTFIVCLSLVLLFVLLQFISRDSYLPEEKAASIVLQKSATIIKQKFNLAPIGSGVAMPDGPIREFFLAFETRSSLSKGELRSLLISIATSIVEVIKNDKNIVPFLYSHPFTISNVQVVIYNHDQNGHELFDPDISVADITKGKLTFYTVDSKNSNFYKHEFKETYEEALKAIKEKYS